MRELYACFQIHSILQGNARDACPVFSVLETVVIVIFFLEAVMFIQRFSPRVVSWLMEKYFTYSVSSVDCKVYHETFQYFCFSLDFLLPLGGSRCSLITKDSDISGMKLPGQAFLWSWCTALKKRDSTVLSNGQCCTEYVISQTKITASLL